MYHCFTAIDHDLEKDHGPPTYKKIVVDTFDRAEKHE